MSDNVIFVETMMDMIKKLSTAYRTNNFQLVKEVKEQNKIIKTRITAMKDYRKKDIKNIESSRQEIEKLTSAIDEKIKHKLLFSEKAVNEIDILFGGLINFLGNLKDYFNTRNQVIENHLGNQVKEFTAYTRDFATMHEERLIKGICLAQSSGVYLDMLYAFSGLFYNLGKIYTDWDDLVEEIKIQ